MMENERTNEEYAPDEYAQKSDYWDMYVEV